MDTAGKELVYEFDGFRIEAAQKCLWHGADLVPLTTKAFDTLLVLVANHGRLVEKDSLLDQVWPDTFVEEATLAQNISTLRKAFAAQEGGMQFIETIPRRGYRFARNVREVEEDDDAYLIETRTSTRVVAEKTEIHDTDPASFLPATYKYLTRYKKILLAGTLVGSIVIAAAFGLSQFYSGSRRARFSQTETIGLVTGGDISRVALSPDGKYLAFIESKNGLQGLKLRQTNSGNTIEIISPSTDEYAGLAFSSGGDSIVYSIYEKNDTRTGGKLGVAYRIPILGGVRSQIAADVDGQVAFSPDGAQIAFVRQVPGERRSDVIVRSVNSNDANERVLASRPLRQRFSPDSISWSPDGKNIAIVAFSEQPGRPPMELLTLAADTGASSARAAGPWIWIGQTAWLGDSSAMIFPAFSSGSPNITDEIWLLNINDNSRRRIAEGVNGILGIGVTGDSNTIAAVRSSRASGLWVSDQSAGGRATIINKSFGDNSLDLLGMDWTRDGRIVYSTAANGNADIWIVSQDGTASRQITDDPGADFDPVVGSSGDSLFFITNGTDSSTIYRQNLDGSEKNAITKAHYAKSISVSPDGREVYFSADDLQTGASPLWKVSAAGGEPQKLTERSCLAPQLSPDGSRVLCYAPRLAEDGKPVGPLVPTVITSDGATVVRQFFDLNVPVATPTFWKPDGTSFSFVKTINGVSNIWIQRVDGGAAETATDFQTDKIFRYRWTADGRFLAFEKGLEINEVFLMRDKENR